MKNKYKILMTFFMSLFTILTINAQNCSAATSYSGSFPATSNGVTISVSYTGGAQTLSTAGQPASCGFSYPAVMPWTGNSTAGGSIIFTFSSPINDVYLYLGVFGTSGDPRAETATITTNAGIPTLTVTSGPASCTGGTVSGNSYTAAWANSNGLVIVHAPSSFTTLTISQVGTQTSTLGGIFSSVCLNSIVSCGAGSSAPTLNPATDFASNTYTIPCGSTTANLSGITASNNPGTLPITYHSGTPATTANKLSSVTALAAGTYYAAFFDSANNCYSPTTQVTVTEANCITANADFGSGFNATAGTASTTPSVIANDTNDGSAVTLGATGNSTLTWQSAAPSGITLNADGTIAVASTTAAGTYNLTYQICDNVVPTNCKTATATVVVSGVATCNAGTVAPTVN